MIDWLREMQDEFYKWCHRQEKLGADPIYSGLRALDYDTSLQFVDYLEHTDASPWVSVEERLPVSAEPVAAATLRMWMRLSYFDREWHHFSDGLWLFWGAPVTHWMPLPRV